MSVAVVFVTNLKSTIALPYSEHAHDGCSDTEDGCAKCLGVCGCYWWSHLIQILVIALLSSPAGFPEAQFLLSPQLQIAGPHRNNFANATVGKMRQTTLARVELDYVKIDKTSYLFELDPDIK